MGEQEEDAMSQSILEDGLASLLQAGNRAQDARDKLAMYNATRSRAILEDQSDWFQRVDIRLLGLERQFSIRTLVLSVLSAVTLLPIYLLVSLALRHRQRRQARTSNQLRGSARAKVLLVVFALIYHTLLLLFLAFGSAQWRIKLVSVVMHVFLCVVEVLLRSSHFALNKTLQSELQRSVESFYVTVNNNQAVCVDYVYQSIVASVESAASNNRARLIAVGAGGAFAVATQVAQWQFEPEPLTWTAIGTAMLFGAQFGGMVALLYTAMAELYDRLAYGKQFRKITCVSASQQEELPHINISGDENLRGWLLLRACMLLRVRDQRTKCNLEVVLSACAATIAPLVVHLSYELLFGGVPLLSLFSLMVAAIVVALVACMHVAATMSNKLIELYCDRVPLLSAALEVNSSKKLDVAGKLLEEGKDHLVVLRVLGIPLKKKTLDVLVTLLTTLGSVLITQAVNNGV